MIITVLPLKRTPFICLFIFFVVVARGGGGGGGGGGGIIMDSHNCTAGKLCLLDCGIYGARYGFP